MDLFTPPLAPDNGMVRRVQQTVRKAQFAEGYSQRSGVLNSKGQVLELSWALLTHAQADAIEEFFDGLRGADAMLYAPPGAAFAPVPWTVGAYDRTDYSTFCEFRATLERVFDLGAWSGGTGGGVTATTDVIRMTAAQFIAANPTLPDGTHGIEEDTNYLKIGDGIRAWNSLDYISSPLAAGTPVAKFEQRTAAAWLALNPVLDPQTMGYEIDTAFAKVGDGANHWTELPYLQMPVGSTPLLRIDAGDTVNRLPGAEADGSDSALRPVIDDSIDAGDSAVRGP